MSDDYTRKRRREQDLSDLDEFNLEDLLKQLQEKGGKDLAATAILDMAHLAGLTLTDLKNRKIAAPGFSKATWNDVAPKFGLDPYRDLNQLGEFSLPLVSLPPSFHREVMKILGQWLDVYQERGAHQRGAARVRLMDAVCTSNVN